MQRPRNRRRGQGQDMDVRPHLLEAFLVLDAEVLLLVDDQKAQVAEPDRFGQHRMGADDDVDRPIGQPLARLLRLPGGHEPRQRADVDRKPPETLGEPLVVLARQQRRGGHDGDLHTRHRRDEGRADRHLGLAKADIAADQPVHRIAAVHVGQHIVDRPKLIVGLGIGETCQELVPHAVGRRQGRCRPQRAFRRDPDQALRHLADAFFQPRLLGLPRATAQLVEQPLLVAVFRQQLDVLDRQEQLGILGVFQRDTFVRRPSRRHHLQPQIPPHAVIDMHDQVAGRQALGLGQEILGPAPLLGLPDQAVAQHVLFRDHRHLRRLVAVFQRPDRQVKPALADPAKVADRDRLGQPFVLDQAGQAFARAFGIGRDDHRPAVQPGADMVGQGPEQANLFLLPLGREVASDAPARVQHTRSGRLFQRGELHHPAPRDGPVPPRIVEIEHPRRRRLVHRIEPLFLVHRMLARLVLVDDGVPPCRALRPGLVVERDGRPRQVVEDRLERVVEEPQPVLHPRLLAPRADSLVKRVVGARCAELDPVGLTEPGDRGLVEDDLGHRRQLDPVELFGGHLRAGIEPACAVQRVAEKVEPHRPRLPRRIDVDDAAAHGVVARLRHRGSLDKTHPHQERAQPRLVDAAADARGERGLAQDRTGRNTLRCGVQRRQQDETRRHRPRKCRQRRHPRGRDVGIGRHPVIGQAVPSRKGQDRHVGREERERGLHRRQTLVVARDVDDRPLDARDLAQDQLRVETFGRARDGYLLGGIRHHADLPPRRPVSSGAGPRIPAPPRGYGTFRTSR